MSKRDLKNFVQELTKKQLEAQIVELYEKFPDVKTYYDFVFNPKEDKLLQEAKLKISNEYFPIRSKKAKLRRSTAQKYIKHFISLGVDTYVVVDVMLYAIEIAQIYVQDKPIKQELFYKSMFNSYKVAVAYMLEKGVFNDFKARVEDIKEQSVVLKWYNADEFVTLVDRLDY